MTQIQTMYFFILLFIVTSGMIGSRFSISTDYVKRPFYPFGLIGIGILSVIPGIQSGMQSAALGTDIYAYQVFFYRNSKLSWKQFFTRSFDNIAFYSFAKLIYPIGGRIVVLTVLSFIIVVLAYFFIRSSCRDRSEFLAMLVFLTELYTPGVFNMLKQCLTVCMFLYAIRYIFENNLVKYVLFMAITFFFHSSIIVALPIYFFWDHKKDCPISKGKQALYISICIAAVSMYRVLVHLFAEITSLDEYDMYSQIVESRNGDFYLDVIVMLLFIVLGGRLIDLDKRNEFYILMMILGVIIGITGFWNPFFKRAAYYYRVPAKIVLTACLPRLFVKKNRIIIIVCSVLYIIARWIVVYFIAGDRFVYDYDLSNRPY